MADDPIEVTVVCPSHYRHHELATECGCCGDRWKGPAGRVVATLAPGSLDEALMRWARAEMALRACNAPGMDLQKESNVQTLSRLCADARGTASAALALWRKEHA